ncbi:MAG: MauE/DoxX family redox-associated membrane protein [Actinomycetota bacterium]
MDLLAVVASTALGAVFLFAGGSKVAGRQRWVGQAVDLGVPRRVAALVPWFEIALGAALIVRIAALVVAVVAFSVLAVFTVLIARQLRRPDRPPCACFGSWSTRPLSSGDIVRNVVLMAVAVVAAVA